VPEWTPFAFYILGGLTTGAFASWLVLRVIYGRRMMKEEIARLRSALARCSEDAACLREQADTDRNRLVELRAALERERAASKEKAAALEEVRARMSESFQAMSAQALSVNNKTFLDLAGTTLSGYIETAAQEFTARERSVNDVVQPVRDALIRYDQELRAMERSREKAYGELSQQVAAMAESQGELHRETARLVNALKTPHVRGRWGEMTLRRVVEIAGMQNRCDFCEQVAANDGKAAFRPDMIVQLPGDRRIVVDAKVSLAAYLDALEAPTKEDGEAMMERHVRQVQNHIQRLSQKAYWVQFAPTPEFVVLFMPGENFLSAALARRANLIEEAAEKGVILSTPTTLISLLKAVAYGWKQEHAAQNARTVSALGEELYNRLYAMVNHLNKLGRDLDRSVESFNQAMGSLEKRVMPSARRLHETGASLGQGKSFPGLLRVENRSRHLEEEQ
jgi:DNA recombination protein RmuC